MRSVKDLTEASIEASNISYTPGDDETLINPMAGVKPRNWSNARSGYVAPGAVEHIKTAPSLPEAVAQVAEDALLTFEREESLNVPPALAAGAIHGVVKQFGVGAMTENAFAADAPGVEILESDDDAPVPESGKSWEDAGWDVVMNDGGDVTTYQIKASSKKRSRWSKKEADNLIFAVVKNGELKKFRNLTEE